MAEEIKNLDQVFGCATNIFDYYTTWSDAAFLVAIVVIPFLPRLRSFAAEIFVTAALCNMITVALVGHFIANYMNVMAITNEIKTSLNQNLKLASKKEVNYTALSVRFHDDLGHLLPLLASVISFCILVAGFNNYKLKVAFSFIGIGSLAILGFVSLYLAIPFTPPDDPTSYCSGSNYLQRSFWPKIYKIYYVNLLWVASAALLLGPAILITILALICKYVQT